MTMTPQKKLSRKVLKKAYDLENGNYHAEAGALFDLAEEIAAGRYDVRVGVPTYIDGERIVTALIARLGP
jgi:hypothetical protein